MIREGFANYTRGWWDRDVHVAQLHLHVDVHCMQPSPCLIVEGVSYGKRIDQTIALVSLQQPFGGERWYAICPITGRRCLSLVLPPGRSFFASVAGWGVAYTSQRKTPVFRAILAEEKAEKRLAELSKYTRQATRQRYEKKLEDARALVEELCYQWGVRRIGWG